MSPNHWIEALYSRSRGFYTPLGRDLEISATFLVQHLRVDIVARVGVSETGVHFAADQVAEDIGV